jgi:hypothetical protein
MKACKECPWVCNNEYSMKFRKYSSKMSTIGVTKHACHMITTDIWGYQQKINEKNICRGQKNLNT